MSKKKKLLKFSQNKTFPNFFEPVFNFTNPADFEFKSKWNELYFKNGNPIILELGCGKGEYTVELSKKIPEFNYIGVDIKGARMWKGATEALNSKLPNTAFVRTFIEYIDYCFGKDEVSEIWITFPDPHLSPRKRIRKRLTSSVFLSKYQRILKNNGIINLKTDDEVLYHYTKAVVLLNDLKIIADTEDLYNSDYFTDILAIKTFYERMWNKEGKTIKYLSFLLPENKILKEPPIDDEKQN
ncbi:MAG TPA: tRNA (guanosine(46)-N7)-methyltransferase TrmB [Bacteroidales bacterium]|nr:tRNA (guanosine(46)-N7)-methyltransferase TrmB [Bacteroidales bacterium]